MRHWFRAALALLSLILLVSLPCPFGWGDAAERLITQKAVDTLADAMERPTCL
jgi:hypothetical protein